MGPVTASWTSVSAGVGVLVLLGLGLPSAAAAGQPRRSAAPSDRALAALAEEEPASRVQTLLTLLPRLESDPSLRGRAELHRAVAAMLEQERSALRDSARAGRLAAEDGTAADLLMLVGLRLLPHASAETRPRLLSAMVWGYYAPGSRFAADLAVYGAAIVDDVRRLAGDESPAHRANAFVLMGRVLNNQAADALEATLSLEQSLDLVNALRAGLDDDDAGVRALVVDAIVAAGDGASVRRLAEVARRDVSPMVRQHAREALNVLGQ